MFKGWRIVNRSKRLRYNYNAISSLDTILNLPSLSISLGQLRGGDQVKDE